MLMFIGLFLARTMPPHPPRMPTPPLHLFLQCLRPWSHRGAKCPTLKTAEKQPKRVPSRSRQNSRKTVRTNSRNTRKTIKTAVFRVFWLFSQLFSAVFAVTHSAPFSAVFRLFCRAFGTLVGGRRDCKSIFN